MTFGDQRSRTISKPASISADASPKAGMNSPHILSASKRVTCCTWHAQFSRVRQLQICLTHDKLQEPRHQRLQSRCRYVIFLTFILLGCDLDSTAIEQMMLAGEGLCLRRIAVHCQLRWRYREIGSGLIIMNRVTSLSARRSSLPERKSKTDPSHNGFD